MEKMSLISARRYIRDREAPVFLSGGEIAGINHYDNRGHRRMDVAKDAHNARPPELHGSRRAGRVEANIENLPIKVRKSVMKDWIEIWEIHGGSRLDHQHMRREPLVLLQHARMLLRVARS